MKIGTDLVRKLVDSQFPEWSNLPVKSVARSGWDNRTFRLGDDLTVRLPSAAPYVSQVHKEQQWLPFLGERLSISIPNVQALGKPGCGYPWPWSVYRWIEGEDLKSDSKTDAIGVAKAIADFLGELHTVDTSVGPSPGLHNYFRGAALSEYDADTKTYVGLLDEEICAASALSVWNRALDTQWATNPVWIHGDLEASNILVSGGKLAAIIDFGNCAVGDPACDLVMAWTYFDQSARHTFRSNLNIDNETWHRARAWALWKALFQMSKSLELRNEEFFVAKHLVRNILSSPL